MFEVGHEGGKRIAFAVPMIHAGVIKGYGKQGNFQAAGQEAEYGLVQAHRVWHMQLLQALLAHAQQRDQACEKADSNTFIGAWLLGPCKVSFLAVAIMLCLQLGCLIAGPCLAPGMGDSGQDR